MRSSPAAAAGRQKPASGSASRTSSDVSQGSASVKKTSRKKEKENVSSPVPVVAEDQASKKKNSADNAALDKKNGIVPDKKLKLDTSGISLTNALILIACLWSFCFPTIFEFVCSR